MVGALGWFRGTGRSGRGTGRSGRGTGRSRDAMFEFSVLGSGSAGNSALVRTGRSAILVDAGLSAKQLKLRLGVLGMAEVRLDGIVLTHEHSDHTRGLDVFLRERGVPVYCNVRTAALLRREIRSEVEWQVFESGDRFGVGDLEVQSFSVPHDAVEPMGFVIRRGPAALGVVSDIGHVTTLVQQHLRGVDSLYVEANYDEAMLQNDTKRPWATKQRIASRHGHLSNAQTAELVEAVASARLHRVVLGHLSRDCNHPEVARKAVEERLQRIGLREVEVLCAEQDEVLGLREVAREAGGEEEGAAERGVRPAAAVRVRRSGVEPVGDWTATQESLFEF
jgi:phosphoribosyl 1,2-cyclic phosphodiesterase